MIESGDDGQQNATSKHKIRGMKDKFPFTTSVIIQEEESDRLSSNNTAKMAFLNVMSVPKHALRLHFIIIANPIILIQIKNF